MDQVNMGSAIMRGQQHRFTDDQWVKILDQVGYGNPHGPLWFLGIEEALPGDLKTDPLLPEKTLRWWLDHRQLPFGSFELFGLPPVANPKTPTWKIMAKLARLILHTADDWAAPEPTYRYIGSLLGRPTGETLLMELLPLPKQTIRAWPPLYSERFPDGPVQYQQKLLARRIKRLRERVDDYQPRIVICYGTSVR